MAHMKKSILNTFKAWKWSEIQEDNIKNLKEKAKFGNLTKCPNLTFNGALELFNVIFYLKKGGHIGT